MSASNRVNSDRSGFFMASLLFSSLCRAPSPSGASSRRRKPYWLHHCRPTLQVLYGMGNFRPLQLSTALACHTVEAEMDVLPRSIFVEVPTSCCLGVWLIDFQIPSPIHTRIDRRLATALSVLDCRMRKTPSTFRKASTPSSDARVVLHCQLD